ncbi:MAG TPA: nucleotide exchange factor GrpE, partial [Gammaproteobacteria bacterium]
MTQESTTPPVDESKEQPAEQPMPEVQELHLMLEDARNKADEHWNQLLRVQAEMENLRRRAERDVESAHKYALEKFAAALLPVKDSLEMGINAANSAEGDVATRLKEGSELTLKMLASALEKFGIKEVDPVGQPFNPDL